LLHFPYSDLFFMVHKRFHINRYYVVGGGFLLIFLVVAVRLFYLQVIKHDYYLAQAKEQHYGSIILPAKRGEILLKDPRSNEYYKLATNITLDLLYVDPLWIEDERGVSEKLAPIVYETLCRDKTDVQCNQLVATYIGMATTPDTASSSSTSRTSPVLQDKNALVDAVAKYIYRLISQKEVTRVILKRFYEDTPEAEQLRQKIQSYALEGVTVTKEMISADPTQIRHPDDVAEKLTKDLDFPYDDLVAKLTRRQSRYVPLINKLPPDLSDQVRALNIKGVVLIPEHWRYYPEKTLAASVIGFLDTSGIGQYGIEGKYNAELTGVEGEIQSQNDPFGRQLMIGDNHFKPAHDGSSVVLTIDRVVQAEVEKRLAKAVEDFKANDGDVVIMDPFTGKIIAMAQYPTFDPNKYADVYKTTEIHYDPGKTMTVLKKTGDNTYLTYVNKFGPAVFVNDMVSNVYDPGSIFKPVTVSIGIDSGEITPRTTYYDTGEISVDEYTIHNATQACLGFHDMTHALNYSCNIGMVTIAKKLGKSLFYNYIINYGFGERTDIELDEESKGVVPFYRNWAAANLATIAFGQGISVTPLQMAVAYSALANGGLVLQPHIVQEIISPDGKTDETGVDIVRRVISKETADTMTAMLISSVENGVARKVRLEKYFIAGKTGTSQIAAKNRAGFEEGEGTTIASFAGYAPANNPKFVMIVKINRPRSSQWGESTAAVLFKDISEFLLEYYNIPPDR